MGNLIKFNLGGGWWVKKVGGGGFFLGIGATVRTSREIYCLPYARLFLL